MLFLCWLMVAFGASPEQVETRLAEVAPLRPHRIEAGAPVMDPATIRKAAGGTIVTGLDGRRAWGVAVLNVPIGKLWAGLNDETFFQLNVTNLFDKFYVGGFGGGLLNTSVPFAQIGAPRAIIGTLVVGFR